MATAAGARPLAVTIDGSTVGYVRNDPRMQAHVLTIMRPVEITFDQLLRLVREYEQHQLREAARLFLESCEDSDASSGCTSGS